MQARHIKPNRKYIVRVKYLTVDVVAVVFVQHIFSTLVIGIVAEQDIRGPHPGDLPMWKKGEKISLPPSFFEKEMAGQDHYQLTAQENIRMATPAEETLGSELDAFGALAEALEGLDEDAAVRVLDWAVEKYGNGRVKTRYKGMVRVLGEFDRKIVDVANKINQAAFENAITPEDLLRVINHIITEAKSEDPS